MRIGHCRRRGASAARFISLILAVCAVHASWGCSRSGSSTSEVGSSTSSLLAKLPNLKPFGVESCTFALAKSQTSRGLVASPSDTKAELKGTAKLSEDGMKALRSQFEWTPIARDDIPGGMSDLAPAGELLFSEALNETFSSNSADFSRGFVLMPADEDTRKIVFLSVDIDHSIE